MFSIFFYYYYLVERHNNSYTRCTRRYEQSGKQISAVPAQYCWSAAIDTTASRSLANGNNSTGPQNQVPSCILGWHLGLGQIMIMTTGQARAMARVGGVKVQGGGVVLTRNQPQINEFMQRLWNEDKVDVGPRLLWLEDADFSDEDGDVCGVSGWTERQHQHPNIPKPEVQISTSCVCLRIDQ